MPLSLCRRTFKLKGNKKVRTWTEKSLRVFRVSRFLCSMYICIYVMNVPCTFRIFMYMAMVQCLRRLIRGMLTGLNIFAHVLVPYSDSMGYKINFTVISIVQTYMSDAVTQKYPLECVFVYNFIPPELIVWTCPSVCSKYCTFWVLTHYVYVYFQPVQTEI